MQPNLSHTFNKSSHTEPHTVLFVQCCQSCCLLSCITATVEYPRIIAARAASKFNINGPVLLANALAAFALNLVRCCSDLGEGWVHCNLPVDVQGGSLLQACSMQSLPPW